MRGLGLAVALVVVVAAACGQAERSAPTTSTTGGSAAPSAPRLTATGPTAGTTQVGAPAAAVAPAAGVGACGRLPRTTCLVTPTCRLDWVSTSHYRCRDAVGPCESGFVQEDSATCASRGCRFVPGHCYCPCAGDGSADVPDGAEAQACDCECGGGPPAKCEPATAGGGAQS